MTLAANLFTRGRVYNKDAMVPVRMAKADQADWEELLHCPDRLKILFIPSSGARLQTPDREYPLHAPLLVFVSRQADFQLMIGQAAHTSQMVAFHPSYFHSDLDWSLAFPSNPATRHHPDSYLLSQFAPEKSLMERLLSIDPGNIQMLDRLFQRMDEQLSGQADPYWTCRSRSYLLQILILATQMCETRTGCLPEEPPAASRVKAIQQYLFDNLGKKISLDDISRKFASNRTSLQELFKQETGMSLMQYLIKLRIQSAEILLRNTGLTLDEVAIRTGLADASALTRSFKKRNQLSPGEYRKSFVFPHYLQ